MNIEIFTHKADEYTDELDDVGEGDRIQASDDCVKYGDACRDYDWDRVTNVKNNGQTGPWKRSRENSSVTARFVEREGERREREVTGGER